MLLRGHRLSCPRVCESAVCEKKTGIVGLICHLSLSVFSFLFRYDEWVCLWVNSDIILKGDRVKKKERSWNGRKLWSNIKVIVILNVNCIQYIHIKQYMLYSMANYYYKLYYHITLYIKQDIYNFCIVTIIMWINICKM